MHIDDSILDDTRKSGSTSTVFSRWPVWAVTGIAGWTGKKRLFRVEKPNTRLGIGMDALPAPIRNSRILSGNGLRATGER